MLGVNYAVRATGTPKVIMHGSQSMQIRHGRSNPEELQHPIELASGAPNNQIQIIKPKTGTKTKQQTYKHEKRQKEEISGEKLKQKENEYITLMYFSSTILGI